MSDQPVTPDREALVRITANALAAADQRILMRQPATAWAVEARQVVDALLPLLTEALDRARQQGRDEVRAEMRDTWDRGMQKIEAALARGGPNRKDEE